MCDVLILGATGFRGELIARYLINHPQRAFPSFTLALGGRSRDKPNKVAESLGLNTHPDSIVVVGLSDYKSVESVVARARVVINVIGPYWKSGECAKRGVHYVDITPEPHFVAGIVTVRDCDSTAGPSAKTEISQRLYPLFGPLQVQFYDIQDEHVDYPCVWV